ncbi:DNA-binding protein H-NS [Allochromatium warmingii]|uniref:DNA-binding protein H-NS n=1 Tax=Allochromatium warmingii TaxID=61595 RepID=A0A1H3B6N9_ALLWA|nr:H-NS histone family protein [Allochromatium warmingii]SDX37616.1 DNA-binding protein H-NS [Allochromatium warmingii]
MEYNNLSLEELQRQLQEADAKRSELEKVLEGKRQEGKGEIVERIKSIILDNGYDPEDIMSLVLRRRRKFLGSRQYRHYVDPNNPDNVYSRGVLPGWMKSRMIEQGYDPSSKEDRETFKSNSLRLVEPQG